MLTLGKYEVPTEMGFAKIVICQNKRSKKLSEYLYLIKILGLWVCVHMNLLYFNFTISSYISKQILKSLLFLNLHELSQI